MCAPVCVRVRAHCSTGRLHATSGGAGGGGGVKGASEPTRLSQDPGGAAGERQGGTHIPDRTRPFQGHTQRQRHTPRQSTHSHTPRCTFYTNTRTNTHHTVTTPKSSPFAGIQLSTRRQERLQAQPSQEHRLTPRHGDTHLGTDTQICCTHSTHPRAHFQTNTNTMWPWTQTYPEKPRGKCSHHTHNHTHTSFAGTQRQAYI